MSIFVFCIGRASIVHEIERQAQQMLGFKKINALLFARHAKDPLRKYQFMYTACDFLKV